MWKPITWGGRLNGRGNSDAQDQLRRSRRCYDSDWLRSVGRSIDDRRRACCQSGDRSIRTDECNGSADPIGVPCSHRAVIPEAETAQKPPGICLDAAPGPPPGRGIAFWSLFDCQFWLDGRRIVDLGLFTHDEIGRRVGPDRRRCPQPDLAQNRRLVTAITAQLGCRV